MFDLIFPSHWSTLKKLIWFKAIFGGSGGGDTSPIVGAGKVGFMRI